MNKRPIAYFGTPDFSAWFLERLLTDQNIPVEVKFVVTQPDRPVGRKGILTPTPVKKVAEKHGVRIVTDRKGVLQHAPTIDLALLYAYGEMIPLDYLKAPKYGFWNIHPSLLPKYRGASPIAYPLMMGEKETGVSLMQMDRELDHGPLLGQKHYQVSPTDFRKNLEDNLTALSYELFAELVPKIDLGLYATNQQHEFATFTRKLMKNDGYISVDFLNKALSNSPLIPEEFPTPLRDYIEKNSTPLPQVKTPAGEMLFNFYRAMHPWPGIWTKMTVKGVKKRLKITEVSFDYESSTLKLTRVQLEGKNEVDYRTFHKAYKFLEA